MQLLAPTLSDLQKNSVLLGLVGYDRLQVIACAGIASHPNSSTTERPTQGVESACVFLNQHGSQFEASLFLSVGAKSCALHMWFPM